MAMDIARLTASIIQKQNDKIAALGESPTLEDIRTAFTEGQSEALIEEIEEHLALTVSNVQVDPQTGSQTNSAEAYVPAAT